MSLSSDDTFTRRYTLPAPGQPMDTLLWVQAAEDGADQIEVLLQRMLELSQQAAEENAPNRPQLQAELERLRQQIDRIADSVEQLRPPIEGTGNEN